MGACLTGALEPGTRAGYRGKGPPSGGGPAAATSSHRLRHGRPQPGWVIWYLRADGAPHRRIRNGGAGGYVWGGGPKWREGFSERPASSRCPDMVRGLGQGGLARTRAVREAGIPLGRGNLGVVR